MLQQNRSKLLAIRSLLSFAVCVALFSFSERTGGDSFSIYLNNKLLLEEHVRPESGVKSVTLGAGNMNDMLKVHYSHCGQIGSKRSLTIKGNDNKVLKSWDFPDTFSPVMDFEVKELLALKKDSRNQRLQLFYSSRELLNGKVLTYIILPDDTKASLR